MRGTMVSACHVLGKDVPSRSFVIHRLIETFLYEVLNYPLDELHDEAERLVHFISESFERRIAAKLGDPQLDPHGHCIRPLMGLCISYLVNANEYRKRTL